MWVRASSKDDLPVDELPIFGWNNLQAQLQSDVTIRAQLWKTFGVSKVTKVTSASPCDLMS